MVPFVCLSWLEMAREEWRGKDELGSARRRWRSCSTELGGEEGARREREKVRREGGEEEQGSRVKVAGAVNGVGRPAPRGVRVGHVAR